MSIGELTLHFHAKEYSPIGRTMTKSSIVSSIVDDTDSCVCSSTEPETLALVDDLDLRLRGIFFFDGMVGVQNIGFLKEGFFSPESDEFLCGISLFFVSSESADDA